MLPLSIFGIDLPLVHKWIEAGGYYVLFGMLFCCGLGLPVPEDIPLVIAGTLIGSGHMSWPVAAVVAWCGIIGGDCVLYYLGHHFGMNITRVPFIGHHVTRKRIERAEIWFRQWGVWVVGVGRMFAGVRGAMVVAAGTIRFNFFKFIIADGLAAIVSGGTFMLIGFWFGKNWDLMMSKVEKFRHVLIIASIAAAIALTIFIIWRSKKKSAERALDRVPPLDITHPAGGNGDGLAPSVVPDPAASLPANSPDQSSGRR